MYDVREDKSLTSDAMDQPAPAPVEEEFELSLKGTGISLTRNVNRDEALQILAIAMGSGGGFATGPRQPQEPRQHQQSPVATGSRMALREYIDQVEAKRNPDKILAIANYLVDHRKQESFTSEQVKGQFRAAAEATPANFARDWRWTITNGWIAPDHDVPGEFYVTSSGHEALAACFSQEVKKKTGQSKLGARRRKKKVDGSEVEG